MTIDKEAVGKRLKAIRVVSGIERKEFVRRPRLASSPTGTTTKMPACF